MWRVRRLVRVIARVLVRRGAQFAVGACTGAALDAVHVRSGVLSYQRPYWRTGQAIWVPLLFGGTAIVLGQLAWMFPPVESRRPLLSRWVRDSAQLAIAYALTSVAADHPRVGSWLGLHPKVGSRRRSIALALLYALFRVRQNGGAWLYTIMVAAVGSVVEAAIAGIGLFRHHHPEVAGVPLWLPLLYANAAPLLATSHSAFV
jgi:hypothetical protein